MSSSLQTKTTTKRGFRTGSIVTPLGSAGAKIGGAVARVLMIVDRRVDNEEKHVRASMSVIQLAYNGQVYVLPTKDLHAATPQEKKRAKFQGKSKPEIPGADIHYVTEARPYQTARLTSGCDGCYTGCSACCY